MSLAYATERSLTHPGPIRRWTQLVSYTTPPATSVTFTRSNTSWISIISTNRFQKTGGVNNWDANTWSNQGANTGTVEYQIYSTSYGFMVGLSYANNVVGYPGINFGISVQPGGTLEVYNNGGSGGGIAGGYTASSVIKMVWTNTLVSYYVNNVFKTSYAKTAGASLYSNVCYNDVNSQTLITMTI